MAEPAETWQERVGDAERRGELFAAFDLAERGLDEHPGDLWLRHRAVLALARAGSTREAQRRFDLYGLAAVEEEDVQALGARLAKDVALAASGEERKHQARAAAALYARIFERTSGYYPGVNAATLLLVAGAADEARQVARRVLIALEREDRDGYWAFASEAEALLVLGREGDARAALERAAGTHDGDYGALSTTRRQLKLICSEKGLDAGLLAAIGGPTVVHYCGHRVASAGTDGRFSPGDEQLVRDRIRSEIASGPPGLAYGSLASGADILFAEALLDAGTEINVVLPFNRDEFVRTSVADANDDWVARFERCLSSAKTVTYATEDAYLGDDILYRYASELAMGLALLRGRFLDAAVRQLAVWDGQPASGAAGTAVDVATWRRTGRPASIIAPRVEPRRSPATPAGAQGRRLVRAMLFADVRGFSKLKDAELPRFVEHVLATLARALDRHASSISSRETWGDALYLVLADAASAAECALDLQEAVSAIDLTTLRLPEHLALRLGGHLGPVFPITNPVTGGAAYMGSHVNLTARVEPVTPPGAVFVTEAFAASLVLAGSRLACDYAGHIPAAKEYGRLRMYRLSRPSPLAHDTGGKPGRTATR